tara:strand:- start:1044 stop:1433 length:390 start_codon:yes stop_codon:yes gene_type:complete
MEEFNPKEKSKGLGDTIAKFTNATGIDKLVETLAAAVGIEDCGCDERRKIANDWLPYFTPTSPEEPPHINTAPLDETSGNYEVLQEINCILPGIGNTILNKGMVLVIDKEHPLYNDIPHYYKINAIKKL